MHNTAGDPQATGRLGRSTDRTHQQRGVASVNAESGCLKIIDAPAAPPYSGRGRIIQSVSTSGARDGAAGYDRQSGTLDGRRDRYWSGDR